MKRFLQFLLRDNVKYFSRVILIFVFLFGAASYSQNLYTLEGKVTDAATNEPLPYVSVFLSQTTIGATTDVNGFYKIGKIPRGKFNLLASMVGYEAKVVDVDLRKEINTTVNFRLERAVYQFNQMEIRDKMPEEWIEQLALFKKLFFGQNEYADYCEIKNPYRIDFSEENSKFTAVAHEPITIINNAFGYKIECVLKSFSFDKRTNSVRYQVFPSFSEIKTFSKDSTEKFNSKRSEAYFGSLAQLLSSLAFNQFKFRDEGFELHTSKGLVAKADQIVKLDSLTGQYYINTTGCIRVKYWNLGYRNFSSICITKGIAEFDPGGFFINPDEFTLEGYMAGEGIATMLPLFWKRAE